MGIKEGSDRISLQQYKIKYTEKGWINKCTAGFKKLMVPVTKEELIFPFLYPHGILNLRDGLFAKNGQGAGCIAPNLRTRARAQVGINFVNICHMSVKIIVAQFILDPYKDQNANGQSDSQA